jgi:hypothetical protein
MKSFWIFAFIVGLASPSAVSAGEKGKLISLFADYADLKQRVQEIQSARKDGYSSDSKEIIALMKEIQTANEEVQTYQSTFKAGSDDKSHSLPIALTYAYNAMMQLISTEFYRNIYKSDLAAKLSDKYADIWQTVDPSIPVFSAPNR